MQIASGTSWHSVYGGGFHSLGLKTDGFLWSWGSDLTGQLGNGTITASISIPTQIRFGSNWQSISDGSCHSLGIRTDANLWARGSNGFGCLGDGTNQDSDLPVFIFCPNSVIGIKEVSDISALYSIYPNPAKAILYVKNLKNPFIDKLIITDILGRKVIEQTENTQQLTIQNLEKTLYHLFI